MAIRKTDDIENEEDNRYNNAKDIGKRLNIVQRFDDTTHNDNPYDGAIQYLAKKLDEIVDETNKGTEASGSFEGDFKILKTASGSFSTRITTNEEKTGISGAQTKAITANTAKTGITTSQTAAIKANTAKVSFPGLGTTSKTAKAGNTTTISPTQATLISGLQKGILNSTGSQIKIEKISNNLVISFDNQTYIIKPSE